MAAFNFGIIYDACKLQQEQQITDENNSNNSIRNFFSNVVNVTNIDKWYIWLFSLCFSRSYAAYMCVKQCRN